MANTRRGAEAPHLVIRRDVNSPWELIILKIAASGICLPLVFPVSLLS
jgi:hypothetical protein